MKSLKIATPVVFTLLIAAMALAAEQGKPKEKGKGPGLNPIAQTMLRIDRIKSAVEGLDLNEDQKQKMEPIGKELRGLVTDALKEVMGVLTPEQREKLQQKIGSGAEKGKKGT